MAMPPESWAGARGLGAGQAHPRQGARCARAASPRATPASSSGRATLAARRQPGRQGRRLEDHRGLAARRGARAPSPRVGASSPASSRSAVDLPQPDGPTRATISPGLQRQVERPQRRPARIVDLDGVEARR